MKRCTALLALCLLPPIVLSQSTNATLSGGVTDPTGNLILDALVSIQNDATGTIYTARTNNSGMYIVPVLPPGHYHVQVTKPGFKTIIKADVVLNVQGAIAINFELPVGATSESVTVDTSSPPLNTTDGSVSTVIDRKFVENMPLNGRSFQDLISMTPGVVTQSPQVSNASPGFQGDFSVNGQRTESNYYTVDGLSAAGGSAAGGNPQPGNTGAIATTTALGTTQSLLSVDALQEFRVSSSTYSAQYGRSPGGQFSFSTRSGTNVLHGSLFDYLRNDAFDSNDWFNRYYGLRKTALRQNDFGGTVGGPIWIPSVYRGIDRSFFFLSYEGLRLVQPKPATTLYVPSSAVRASAPTVMQSVLNAFPLPTGPEIASASGVPTGLSPFVQGYSLPAAINSTSLRLDQNLFGHWSIFGRVAYSPSLAKTRNLSSLSTSSIGTTTYSFGLTGQLRSHVNNDLRVGYTKTRSALDMTLDSFGGATPVNLRSVLGVPESSNPSAAEPYIVVSGVGTTNIFAYNAITKYHQWNLTDTLGIELGRHYVSAGFDHRHIESPILPPSVVVLSQWFTRSSMLTNSADSLSVQKNAAKTPVINQFSAFIQDEWRISPILTLSSGIRWEVSLAPREANGKDAYTVNGDVNRPSTLTLAPRGTPLWNTYWYNFAPRVGVAWTARGSAGHETVLRLGGGSYFDTGNQASSQGFLGVGFYAFKNFTKASIPVTDAQKAFTTDAVAPYTSTGIYAFPHRLQLPYSLQWSLAVEQALGKAQSLTVSYIGSSARRLLGRQQHNVGTINPQFGTIYYYQTGVTSRYDALQAKFQRTVAHGLQALVSYTWSHSLDYGSNNSSLPLTYGSSDFDVRHNIQVGMGWDLPKSHGNRLLQTLVNDWGLDDRVIARTGFPITLQGKLFTDPASGNRYNGNLNLVPGKPIYLYGAQYPGGMAINPAAFTYPADLTDLGNAPRNFVRGFGTFQWNAGVRRTFHIVDPLSLVFRAEAFNVLNHPNFGYIDPTLSDAQFGRASAMLNQSLGSTNQLYQQGGPRSLQFSLKLNF